LIAEEQVLGKEARKKVAEEHTPHPGGQPAESQASVIEKQHLVKQPLCLGTSAQNGEPPTSEERPGKKRTQNSLQQSEERAPKAILPQWSATAEGTIDTR